MKKLIPFIIMLLVLAGVVVGINVLQDKMDSTSGSPSVMFSATDRKGMPYTESVFSENKITMINLWEPWCGPCVSEMPGIQRLYSTYKDKGLMVIGVYTTDNMEFQVSQVLRDADDRNTRIYVSDNLYIYGKSGKLTSLDQLKIPKGLNVRRFTRGFPYG